MNQLRTYKAYIGPFGEFHHFAHVGPVRNQSGKHVRAEFPKGNAISPLAQSQCGVKRDLQVYSTCTCALTGTSVLS